MSVDFAEASESCLDGILAKRLLNARSKATESNADDGPSAQEASSSGPILRRNALKCQDALGANAWAVARGQGLMYLVHLRLRRFAQDFESK